MIRARFWLGVPVVLALGAVGVWYQTREQVKSAMPAAVPAIPVTATTARQQDVALPRIDGGLRPIQLGDRQQSFD